MNLAFALLLDMTLKASLLCLAALVLASLSRKRSAAVRHDVWMSAVAVCALLPFVAAATRFFAPAFPAAPVHEIVMMVTPSLPAATPAGAIETVDRIWSGDGGAADFGGAAAMLAALWLAGFALAALRVLSSYRAAAAIVRRARPFGVPPRGVRLLVSDALDAPAVFGIFRPAILLPPDAEHWSADRVGAVLAHELAHVERRDCAIELLAQFACALHWFNPLVQLAARALRTEREFACDERVVTAGFDPRRYAAALVQVARFAFGPPHRAMLAMARAPELERRVVLLLGPRRRVGRGRLRGAFAWAAVTLFLALAALTAPASGLLASGSVQPGDGPLGGLDDPMSERVPFDYQRFAAAAADVPAAGPEAAAIAVLKAHLGRQSHGHGDLVRERSIWTLAQLQDGRLFEPLAALAADADWRIRAYAAWGLAASTDGRTTARLAAMLDDPVWRVRAMAASALAGRADPASAEAMVAASRDPAWQVRIAAIHFAERLGDPAFARRLRPLLDDPHHGTRLSARDLAARF